MCFDPHMIELPAKPRLPPRLGLEPRSSTHGSKGFDRMFLPDGEVEVLARDMLKQFPADAADRAMLFQCVLCFGTYRDEQKVAADHSGDQEDPG